MYQPLPLFIGLRYIRGRNSDRFARFVSWLSSIGITLGVMAMVIVVSIMNGFEREQKQSFLSTMPHAVLTAEEGSLSAQEIPKNIEQLSQNIQKIVPLTLSDVVIQSAHGINVVVMLGVKKNEDEPLLQVVNRTLRFENGQNTLLQEGKYQIAMGEVLAKELQVNVGDSVRVMIPSVTQLTPMGRIPSQRLFTLSAIFSSGTEADVSQVVVNQQDASKLMRYPAGNITGWRLFLADPFQVENMSKLAYPDGLIWQDWRVRKGELFQAIKMEKNIMGLLISLIIVVAAFNLIISLGLLVMDKQGEVAILQTLGLTRARTMSIFIILGATTSVIGTMLGAITGLFLVTKLNPYVAPYIGFELPVEVRLEQVAVIVIVTIALALLATLYPSWRAASVKPAEALRYE